MKKRVMQTVCHIILMSIIFTGCSDSLKSENDALKKELTEVKSKISSLESANRDLADQLEEQKEKSSVTKVSAFDNKDNIYTIYSANINTYQKEADAYVYIPNSIDIKQKLITIANILSEGYFSNLPIELVEIEKVNDKKIAVINLKESNENQGVKDYEKLKGKTWATNYLQGSAGGSMTSIALIETLLQREHTGEWIDGVRFLYNGGPCDADLFQHAPNLTKVNLANIQSPILYTNIKYGFSFLLPDSWKGYSIVNGAWEGFALGGENEGKVVETNQLISIRHPQWTSQNPRQDIPIMIFTLEQWDSLKKEKFHIGAAPIDPSELGRNNSYVFALPARYNFAFLPGYEEVEKILNSNPLQTAPK